MKHLKSYKLFESHEEDIDDIKDLFQNLADEWDIYFVEEIDWFDVLDGDGENNFIYSIQSISSPNHPYKLLVNFILPEDRNKPIWKNFDKFISEVEVIESRLRDMGYENVSHHQFYDEGQKDIFKFVFNL